VLVEYLKIPSTVVKISTATEESSKQHGVSSGKSYLVVEEKPVATSVIEIAHNIANKSAFHKALFGKDKGESDQIEKFLELWAENRDKEKKFDFLNKVLETKTFTVLDHITICDILAYVFLFPEPGNIGEKQKHEKFNMSRFADFIQHLPGLSEVLRGRHLTFSLQVEHKWDDYDKEKKKAKKEDKFKAKEEHFKQKETTEGTAKTETAKNTEKKEKKDKPKEEKKNEEPKEETKDKPKEETKEKKTGKESKPQAKKKEEEDVPAISKLDFRVGKIIKIFENTESDKLYNEEIDIGNGEIRTIASGLKKRINIEVLRDSLVIVLCNLKPRNLKGWNSHGMVMCASVSEEGEIEALRPPEGSQPGDLVTIGTYPRKPVAELNPKKNPFDEVKDSLKVNDNLVACFGDAEWTTPKGKVKTSALKNVKIS